MGYRHATGTDGHDGEYPAHLAVQTELTEHGRHQRRGGHQSDGSGPLGGLQRGGNDKGHEQTYAQRGQGLAKIIAQRGGGQHGAESAAGTGDQQDGRRGDDALGYPVMELLTLVIGLEQRAGQRQTDCQGEDRLAEERDDRIQGALAQRPTRKGGDGTQADQQDGHEDGGEGAQGGGQLAIAVAHGLIIDRKSTRLNSSHVRISYAVFCLKKKKKKKIKTITSKKNIKTTDINHLKQRALDN